MAHKRVTRVAGRLRKRDPLVLVRRQIVASLHDDSVHAVFERAFAGVPPKLRGVKPPAQPFTLWQILEHLRLCVLDFMDTCRTPDYVEPEFPDGFWPHSDTPASDREWTRSLSAYRSALKTFEQLISNPSTDLLAAIPGTGGRTVLRQAIACIDHNGYHLGQAVLARRALGIWK